MILEDKELRHLFRGIHRDCTTNLIVRPHQGVDLLKPSARAAAATLPKRSLASKSRALSSKEYLRFFRTAGATDEEPHFFVKEHLELIVVP